MEQQMESMVLEIKRVAKTTKGKKRIRFTALVAVGNKQGRVGIALAKAPSVATAVQKAVEKAKRSLITTHLTSWHSLPHRVEVKQDAVRLIVKPAPRGTGVKAGGVIRSVLSLAGYQNVTAKVIGSSNKTAAAYAVMKALSMVKPIKVRRL